MIISNDGQGNWTPTAGGWNTDSVTGHKVIPAADLTITNVPSGVYLVWIECNGDSNTETGQHYCYANSVARNSYGWLPTGWGSTV